MKILITGSRSWCNRHRIECECLDRFRHTRGLDGQPPLIVHGAAPGADSLADEPNPWPDRRPASAATGTDRAVQEGIPVTRCSDCGLAIDSLYDGSGRLCGQFPYVLREELNG